MALAEAKPDVAVSSDQGPDNGRNVAAPSSSNGGNHLSVSGSGKVGRPFPTDRVQAIYDTTYKLFVEVLHKKPEEAKRRADLLTKEWRQAPDKK